MHRNELDIKEEEKKLYEEYKQKLAEIRKIKKEGEAVGQVFTKGLLPLYVLFILSLAPTNGNDIANQIGKRTDGLWIPSTGGIYPILKKMEKKSFISGKWNDESKKKQKIYNITDIGLKELENKKYLLKDRISDALHVFEIVYKDLYEK
ncbi:DNA-binding PadR family transcriptional regulator [Clostridium acetobutylicum]|uniref:Predicted transcriptional regulator n=1 Tax=Clostridium acetobutylicum (strain ATCC 824 / DSM 792 / JCM 1419 / IAM 19013 / LMG 5710 / NBRC 13948 / NRRL B-527 / VKM B-1787 / 2291 / W) TaxID=272562 RepID=Q97KH0_CLOAB|nr:MULTISPECIES: PadR family transcriptional regulator [Clostridium]AAK78925.1 Predicted transcriptional regulator [Clostridium acetobutylicum ATCC 824]ADZ20000.1 transcriptional regulator [Clostridium acetobutylicum EA 2018]AEI31514.1 transcriptional regulator [Clostridium acetobutylicum DSM 1731]AWV80644.1 PadR family transcriptional regulator [Clostridium acetobutylicum]KHD35962.1 PadR family transcriptional regulator [Clostridium acetobutylicum]